MPFPTDRSFPGELRRWRASRGWSQLDLAIRAGTTQRHVSFIEQGRSVPGRGVVVRLAESLGLTLRERNRLLVAAGFAPLYVESAPDSVALQPTFDALARIVAGHLPYPAVVVRPYGELVFANAALDVLLDGVADELLHPPVNVLRVALHPAGMAKSVANLAEWGRHIVESLRAMSARSPSDAVDALVDELASYLPEPPTGSNSLGFAVPLRYRVAGGELSLITTLTSFATATDVTLAELTLEAFLPGDAFTASYLRQAHGAGSGAVMSKLTTSQWAADHARMDSRGGTNSEGGAHATPQ